MDPERERPPESRTALIGRLSAALQDLQAGRPPGMVFRDHGISVPGHAAAGPSSLSLERLERENQRLRKLVAHLTLLVEVLRERADTGD